MKRERIVGKKVVTNSWHCRMVERLEETALSFHVDKAQIAYALLKERFQN